METRPTSHARNYKQKTHHPTYKKKINKAQKNQNNNKKKAPGRLFAKKLFSPCKRLKKDACRNHQILYDTKKKDAAVE